MEREQDIIVDHGPQLQEKEKAPGVCKTRKMLAVEAYVGDLGEFLGQKYVQEKSSLNTVCEEIFNLSVGHVRVSKTTIGEWLCRFGYAVRDPWEHKKDPASRAVQSNAARAFWQDPAKREKIIESQREAWADPERRAERLAAMHSPFAEEKRSKAASKRLQDPTARERLSRAGNEGRKAAKLRRMKKALGEDPKERLEELYEEYHSVNKIGEVIGRSYATVASWMDELGADRNRGRGIARVSEENRELVEKARKDGLLANLGERELLVLEARYPEKGRPKTLEAVGQGLEVTRERARQIEVYGLRQLGRLSRGEAFRPKRGSEEYVRPFGANTALILEYLYLKQHLSIYEIAHIIDRPEGTISKLLDEFGVEKRGGVKARKGYPAQEDPLRTIARQGWEDGLFGELDYREGVILIEIFLDKRTPTLGTYDKLAQEFGVQPKDVLTISLGALLKLKKLLEG